MFIMYSGGYMKLAIIGSRNADVPNLEKYLPEGVTEIGSFFFYECANLEQIILPSSVTQIYDYAFDKCDNLKTVYYTGTREQWNITVDFPNEPFSNATICYYSEATPSTQGNYWRYVDGVPQIWDSSPTNEFVSFEKGEVGGIEGGAIIEW